MFKKCLLASKQKKKKNKNNLLWCLFYRYLPKCIRLIDQSKIGILNT